MTQTIIDEESPSQEQVTSKPECMFCGQAAYETDIKVFPCGENACRLCLNDAFEGATLDESRFPPRCSHQEIRTADVQWFLFRAVSEAYERKAPEMRTKHRTYCHDVNCATWIPPRHIVDGKATCTSCRLVTCAICKRNAHRGDCPDDPTNQAFLATAEEHGYRQCHLCMRMVELNHGCNHIV